MKKLLLLFVLFGLASTHLAQNFGHEWIDYSARYYKFPVNKASVYRLDSATLSGAFNLTTSDPRNYRIFLNGKEQKIYIKGESDGKINTGDYVEFFADPSVYALDSLLYDGISYVPGRFTPLYSDTIYAFITESSTASSFRLNYINDTIATGMTASSFFYSTQYRAFRNTYNAVELEIDNSVSDPVYTQAEGWGLKVQKGQTGTFNFGAIYPYTLTPLSFVIQTAFSGMIRDESMNPDNAININYLNKNNTSVSLEQLNFTGYTPFRKNYTINAQNTGNGFSVQFQVPTTYTHSMLSLLHYAHIYYPRKTELGSDASVYMFMGDNPNATKTLYNFINFSNSSAYYCYDLTNGRRLDTRNDNGTLRVIVPNGSGNKKCFLIAENAITMVSTLKPAGNNGILPNLPQLLSQTNYLIISASSLVSGATQYSNFRSSALGGNYLSNVVDIRDLYEQFAYGCQQHPLAIRNALRYWKKNAQPKYVFLIGKGIRCDFINNANKAENLLPAMGAPVSDLLYTSNLSTSGDWYTPEIPIARLSALTNYNVLNYLNKVITAESTPNAEWNKRVLHFIGGDNQSLVADITQFMGYFKSIIKDTLWGADVITYSKSSTEPVQTDISETIRKAINNGAGIINVFGHGAREALDLSIDDPSKYDNAGKLPLFIALSCFTGDMYDQDTVSVSERFVLYPNKGSIAFLAPSGYGTDFAMNHYCQEFYRQASRFHYTDGIGDMQMQTAIETGKSDQNIVKFLSHYMVLNGDPAVRLNKDLLPDYEIKNSGVTTDIRSYTDSIGVKIKYSSLTRSIRDTMFIRIVRELPNGDSMVVIKKPLAAMFMDSLQFYMPIDFDRGFGLNRFRVKLDPNNLIAEKNENNNATIGTIDVFIAGADLLPIYPYKFAIVPSTNSITLKASTNDPFAPPATYVFQLDTTDKFSPPLKTFTISSAGGVIEWPVQLLGKDSLVYFWRVSRDSISPQAGYLWRESSFQTINNRRGWGQTHFFQHKGNTFNFINFKRNVRQYTFFSTKHSIAARTGIHPFVHLSLFNYWYDTGIGDAWSSAFDGWNFAVFDSISGKPIPVFSNNYPSSGSGPYNSCVEIGSPPTPRLVYSFGAVRPACGALPTWKSDMESFINSIPNGCYVLGYSTGFTANNNYSGNSTYANSLLTAFESIGAKKIRTTPDSVGYIFLGRKSGNVSRESIGANKKTEVWLYDSVPGIWNYGSIVSEKIGPSAGWQSVHWRITGQPSDSTVLKLVGIRQNGDADTLARLPKDSMDVNLSNYIDHKVHPYISLVMYTKDKLLGSPVVLNRWQVLYEELPECAVNPLRGYQAIKDTVQQGDPMTLKIPIENTGALPFKDSILIHYWYETPDKNKVDLPNRFIPGPFTAGQVWFDTIKVDSYKLNGNHTLWMQVNPNTSLRYQPEMFAFNNFLGRPFRVTTDNINPLLDVTFDGVRIMNGEIINPRPTVLITLKDENQFLLLNDTSAFNISLQSPRGTLTPIYFAQGLQFTPATDKKNSATILYTPTYTLDGIYTLKVQARDRSNNKSASSDYVITFEIDNHPAVTNVVNYPNPFSTSTRFVFTLTGSEIPEVFTIQIMTISGKIVREIKREELGTIRIGKNITEYAWDAKDDFGDRLANGVYLYRVLVRLNGQKIDLRNTAVDQYFTKEFGKMVIMR